MSTARRLNFGPMAVHIGEEILRVLTESKMPKTAFADSIGRNRTSVYDVFEQPGCDTVLLRKISTVLRYNFFELLSKDFAPVPAPSELNEPTVGYQRQPMRSPLRIVIEVDPNDPEAKGEAMRMARSLVEKQKRPKK